MDKWMFLFYEWVNLGKGFSGDSVVKNLPVNSGDVGWIPGSGRFLGEGNGNPLQYSCLVNPRDKRTWQTTVQWDLKRVRHDLVTKQQRTTSTSKILALKNHPSDLNVYSFPSSVLHKLHPNHQPLKSSPTSILTLSQASLTSQSKGHHI